VGGTEKGFQSFKIFLVIGKPKWPVTKIQIKVKSELWDAKTN
jgi:hypothetical protein